MVRSLAVVIDTVALLAGDILTLPVNDPLTKSAAVIPVPDTDQYSVVAVTVSLVSI